MPRIVLGLAALSTLSSIPAGNGVIEAFAPVINSGSGVLTIAFITRVYVWRLLSERKDN